MSDLRELYQEVILDHSKAPRNLRPMPQANREAEGFNALCGDKVTVHLHVEDGVVQDISFEGKGCAISTAAASLMTESVKGKRVEEIETLWERYHAMLTGDPSVKEEHAEDLGKLAVMSGVREFPVRVKCATLSWHTLKAALDKADEVVSTE
jgi:nitrogen fixation NifU-like protein